MNYSMLLHSFALAKYPQPKLFQEVGQLCTAKVLRSTQSASHVIMNLVLAFSEAGVVNRPVFEALAEAASGILSDYRTSQIAALAQAFAKVEICHDRLFEDISAQVVSRLAEFKGQDLQDLLHAYG